MLKQRTKFGYTVQRWEGSSGYRHAAVEVWKMQKWDDSRYWSKDRMVSFTWQTEQKRPFGWRLWYGLEVKPGSDRLNRVEDINAFATFMRKLIRKMENETLNNATPAQMIVALESIKVKAMVTDRRDNREIHFVDEVAPADHIAFNLREPDGEYVIERFFAVDEDRARDQALHHMADRASGFDGEHRRVKQLVLWVSGGMPMQQVYEDAPDIRPARERLNDGMVYINFSEEEVDDLGNPINEITADWIDKQALDQIGAAIAGNEEE